LSEILYKAIGVIRSEHVEPEKTPIQPRFAADCEGRVEIFPEYAEGLQDIEGFSHIYLIYHLDRSKGFKLLVKPFLQDVVRGVFATRAPSRPNPIGISIVEIIERKGNTLFVKGLDILDNTPLLDIKPYSVKFDNIKTRKNGWQDDVDEKTAQKRGRRDYKSD